MRKYSKYVQLVFISLVLFTGCQRIADEMVGKKPENVQTINITMVAKSSSNPVFLSARIGAEAAAEDLSDRYSMIDVNINWRTPLEENAEEQAERIRNAVNDGTDAIIVSCSDDSVLTGAINFAVEKGAVVMTFDSDAPDSKRFAFYGPNDEQIGQNVMKELAPLIAYKGKVAILGGSNSAPNLQKRVKGVLNAAEEYDEIEIVGEFYHIENAESAMSEVLRVTELYPDLAGWAMVGGWPFFSEKFIDLFEPGRVKIVAVDALPVQLPYLDQGVVDVLLGQPTFKWGEVCVEKIVDKLYLEKEVDEINEMKLIRVSKDNLGGWSRQLRAWGYDGLPDKFIVM